MRQARWLAWAGLVLAGVAAMALLAACGTAPTPVPGTTSRPAPTAAPSAAGPVPSPSREATVAQSTLPPASPTPLPTPSSTPTPGCLDQASFVDDVTVPDNTAFLPGQSFVKTWRLRNVGTCTWTVDYALAWVRGERLGGAAVVPLPVPVAPGATVDLSVGLTAPAGPGTYVGYWQLRNARNQPFGIVETSDGTFVVRIVVPAPTPVPSATPIVPTATPAAITHWRGEYYPNIDLTGAPALVRDDVALDFTWGMDSPDPNLIPGNFAVRWTRVLTFTEGLYHFSAIVSDGVRVFVDNAVVIDSWMDGPPRTVAGDLTLAAGGHAIRVEYYDHTQQAILQVTWNRVQSFPDWQGQYWDNPALLGAPVLVRDDVDVDFNWGSGSPGPGVPNQNFSARWTRTLSLDGGNYRFHVLVDDGARLWVDGTELIDAWQSGGAREVTATMALAAGNHDIRLDYYQLGGVAQVRLWWEQLPPVAFPDWTAEYFGNMALSGNPVLVRDDVAIDFNWGLGRPAPGVPADRFSVRWSRWLDLPAGLYTFYGQADNGLRFYLDGRLLIDAWSANAKETFTAQATLSGSHHLVVEYHDNAGAAQVHFWWTPLGPTPVPTPVP